MLRLPTPALKRMAIRVTKDAQRQIRGGHPWVFEQSIESDTPLTGGDDAHNAGDLAVIFDHNRNFLAIGLFDPGSPIRIKILHSGRPKTIDADFWEERLGTAIEQRKPLQDDAGTSAYRLVNGENDALPGLIVDRYDSWLVIKLYSAAWLPHLTAIVAALRQLLKGDEGPAEDGTHLGVVLRLSRNVAQGETYGASDGMVIQLERDSEGDPILVEIAARDDSSTPSDSTPSESAPSGSDEPSSPTQVSFVENGLSLQADLLTGQKTGHFLDQRDNRSLASTLAQGRRVLDVFCCTGGFTLAAAAGGAKSVHAIDQAPLAVETLIENVARNQSNPMVQQCKVTTSIADAFEEMERLADDGQRFDLIIVDPPSFAQKQADISRAQRAYRRLTSLALVLLAPEGILVQSSCSSRLSADRFFDGVHEAARLNGYDLRAFNTTDNALDHPVTFPQGSYLKAIYARPVKL